MTTLHAFGDSITVGVGASYPYAPTVANFLRATLDNQGISGSQIQDQIASVYASQPPAGDVALLLTGYNDMRAYGVNSATYEAALRAAIAWLACAGKVKAQSCAFSYVGSWTTTPVYGGNIGKCSTTPGNKANVTLSGSGIYIGAIALSSAAGTLRVHVDGVDRGLYSCSGSGVSASGCTFSPFLIVIEGLTSGSHSVEITHEGAGTVYVDWAAGAAAGPAIYVGECLPMTATGYALASPTWSNGSDAIVAQYNRAIWKTVGMFRAHGLNVKAVAMPYEPIRHVGADGIHPSDAGQQVIASAFMASMQAA